jgi:type II secretory pathway pseudopilin PulG
MTRRSPKRANPRRETALTATELLVCLFVFGILILFVLPGFGHGTHALVKGQMTQTLSNMKQLHLATQLMALDGYTTGDKSLGWPGDTGSTFTNWTKQLVPSYLGTNDFCKLLSAPGVIVPAGKIPTAMSQVAVLVYAVSSNSSDATVFLTTANFTHGPEGGKPLEKSAKPYGDKGFVVFQKLGDGAILLKNQATNAKLVGEYVPLVK